MNPLYALVACAAALSLAPIQDEARPEAPGALPLLLFDEGVLPASLVERALTALNGLQSHLGQHYGDLCRATSYQRWFWGDETSFYFVLELDDGHALQATLERDSSDAECQRAELAYNALLTKSWRAVLVPLEGRHASGRVVCRTWRVLQPQRGRRAEAVLLARELVRYANAIDPDVASQLYVQDAAGTGRMHLFLDHASWGAWHAFQERIATDDGYPDRADALERCLAESTESIPLFRDR